MQHVLLLSFKAPVPARRDHGASLDNENTDWFLNILAKEMTSPTTQLLHDEAEIAGSKRKSRSAPPVYNLSDLRSGKGTLADPVSFLEIVNGATTLQAAIAFYQVSLMLSCPKRSTDLFLPRRRLHLRRWALSK